MYNLKAIVNLQKLKDNTRKMREKLLPNTKLCAVVKSNAYGHGAKSVSTCLEGNVNMFAVNTLDEGIELRLAGIYTDILILLPPFFKIDILRASKYNLILTICSFEELQLVQTTIEEFAINVRCHIKINTGMNRLGFEIWQINELLKKLSFSMEERLKVEGVYSHLYDSSSEEKCNRQLIKLFIAIDGLKTKFEKLICHISATGGIFLAKKYHLDMVRIGLGLYGYTPYQTSKIDLEPILSVYSRNFQSRRYFDGGLGYYEPKRQIKKEKPMLSTLSCGYGDGFQYSQFNFLSPLCMSMGIIKGERTVGEFVKIFDNAERKAFLNKTITYDILVNSTRNAEFEYIF